MDAVQKRATGYYGFVGAALLGTLLSMVRTGHVTGPWNNMFHLPILAGLADMPQFAHDPFVQTLPYYASGLWLFLIGAAPGDAAFPLMLALAIGSRFLAMVGFLACADAIGIRDLRGRLLFIVLIAFSSILNGYSAAGGGGLFISYFTHSEVANATILLSIWCAARGRFTEAFAFNGLTFFLNAFMGVWAAVPMGMIAILLVARGEIGVKTVLIRMAIGVIPFLILAAPAIHLIFSNPEFGRPIDFDFPTFLTEYFPDHFLVTEIALKEIAMLGIVTASGLVSAIALARLEKKAAFCLVALIAFAILWLAGTVLPQFTRSPTLLSLHLLRAGAGIHLFGALAMAALTVLWTRQPDMTGRRLCAPLLAIVGSTNRYLLLLTALIVPIAARLRPSQRPRLRLDIVAAALLVLAIWPVQAVMQWRALAVFRSDIVVWRSLGLWAKDHSTPDDIFLLPIANIRYPFVFPAKDPTQRKLADGYEVFQFFAERRIWADVRSGGAVMWSPGYHHVWRERLTQVMALPDHAARLAYARASGITWLIDACGAAEPALASVAGRCVYRVTR